MTLQNQLLQMQGGQPKEPEQPLPLFRRDLELYQAPNEPDGSPAYSLFDPTTAQYYKITWGESTLMKSLTPGMTMSELIAVVEKKTTIRVSPEEVMMFFEQAKRSNLLVVPKPSVQLIADAEKTKVHPLKWLLFHYLYFRIPICNPDKFLTKTLYLARYLASPIALAIYGMISILGIVILLGRLDEFFYTFPYFFSFFGAMSYSLAIILTKILHELGHGYVAKHFKVRVPRMGLAFILFWPVLYTDITDSWKLDDRKQRLGITAAGVIVELIIAGMCTLGWALSPPGIMQSVFFIVSSITWISTLLVNVNPAMRFDGYYLFSDILGVDNLQMRAFAYTRWRLRKWFLGLDVPPPEEVSDRKRRIGMMAYTVYTWIYRLFLYTAIAILVYTQFAKALGIFLFFLEIGVFLVWPFTDELKRLFEMRKYFKWNFRLCTALVFLSGLFIWLFIPFPHNQSFTSVVIVEDQQTVYVPNEGVVDKLYVERGSEVVEGEPITRIFSKKLDTEIKGFEAEKKLLETEIDILSGSNKKNRAHLPEKIAELASIEETILGLKEQRKQNMLYSSTKGTVYEWSEEVFVGQAVAKDQVLGKITNLSNMKVVCFVPENYIDGVFQGADAKFFLEGDVLKRINGKIESISPVRTEVLIYPQISSLYHGELPVIPGPNKELLMVESFYSVVVLLEPQEEFPMRLGQRGEVVIRGKWRSKAWGFLKRVWSLFWEESTF